MREDGRCSVWRLWCGRIVRGGVHCRVPRCARSPGPLRGISAGRQGGPDRQLTRVVLCPSKRSRESGTNLRAEEAQASTVSGSSTSRAVRLDGKLDEVAQLGLALTRLGHLLIQAEAPRQIPSPRFLVELMD